MADIKVLVGLTRALTNQELYIIKRKGKRRLIMIERNKEQRNVREWIIAAEYKNDFGESASVKGKRAKQ